MAETTELPNWLVLMLVGFSWMICNGVIREHFSRD